jgi:hypothetical protein
MSQPASRPVAVVNAVHDRNLFVSVVTLNRRHFELLTLHGLLLL